MITFSVSDIQPAKEALEQELKKLMTDKVVLVGIHEDAGTTEDGGLSMAGLGAALHFGANIHHPGGTSYGYKYKKDIALGKVSFLKKGKGVFEMGVTQAHTINIPPRPWLDVGVKSGTPDYMEVIENASGDLDNALEIIGQIAVGKVQTYMTDLRDPPNAPSTIKKKGTSNPLIASGALRQSVTYSVTHGQPKEGIE